MGRHSNRQKGSFARSRTVLPDGHNIFSSAATAVSQLSNESARSLLLSTSEQLKTTKSDLLEINNVLKPIASSLFDPSSAQIGSTVVHATMRFSPYFKKREWITSV